MNVKFSIEINSSNDAFQDGVLTEIGHILDAVVDKMWNGQESGSVRDTNGNKVGEWSLTITTEDDENV